MLTSMPNAATLNEILTASRRYSLFQVGFPIMLVSTFVIMIYLVICHVAFDWQ